MNFSLRRRFGSVAAALALAVGVVSTVAVSTTVSAASGSTAAVAAPGQARSSACPPADGAYQFCATYGSATADKRLFDQAADQLDAAGRGDQVRIAMYVWKWKAHSRFKKAVVDAHEKGVRVKVLLGSNAQKNATTFRKLTNKLGAKRVSHCGNGSNGACLRRGGGNKGLMHAKFITIKAGPTTRVITLSSNITGGQFKKAQNSLTVINDAALHGAYRSFWDQMSKKQWTWGPGEMDHAGSADLRKVFFFPRQTGDPIAGIIDEKSCKRKGDQIRVLASEEFRSSLVKSLRAAKLRGCFIRITVNKENVRNAIVKSTKNVISAEDIVVRTNNHSKVVYIRRTDKSGAQIETVFIGSHNVNKNNLRHADDVMLRVQNAGVAAWYRGYVTALQ